MISEFLTPFKMYSLFFAYQATGNVKYRNTLVKRNLGLVRKVVNSFTEWRQLYDDLFNEGVLALIKAVERFDPSRGHKFSTFAMPYITGKIQQYFRDKHHLIRLPQSIQSIDAKAKKVYLALKNKLGREPSDEEIANALSIKITKYLKAKQAILITRNLISINSETEQYL